jgi:hypothetical protein
MNTFPAECESEVTAFLSMREPQSVGGAAGSDIKRD